MGRHKKTGDDADVNMTPMIDVVFQMIIFFVCTIELEKAALNEDIILAISPEGPAVETKVPGTVIVELDARGRISIAQRRLTIQQFVGVMQKTLSIHGKLVPVVIRADGRTQHQYVSGVMDACKQLGFYKVKFVALKHIAEGAE